MVKTEQELIALVRAYFEYLSWFVAEGSHEFERWKARVRQEALAAEKVAILSGASRAEIEEARRSAVKSLGEPTEHPQEWAVDEVRNIIEGAAGDAWQLVLTLVELVPDNDGVGSSLAAGPIEDFLVLHGSQCFAQVEQLATSCSCFKDLLGGVWQNTMSDELWGKVKSIRGDPW
jgi:hypothetical protein